MVVDGGQTVSMIQIHGGAVLFSKTNNIDLNPKQFFMLTFGVISYIVCQFSPRFVSMEMVAIFDFRALTKVHITLKPFLQMQ